jgi:hypothetical protein
MRLRIDPVPRNETKNRAPGFEMMRLESKKMADQPSPIRHPEPCRNAGCDLA